MIDGILASEVNERTKRRARKIRGKLVKIQDLARDVEAEKFRFAPGLTTSQLNLVEEWKSIPGMKGYRVSTLGRVLNEKTKKIVKSRYDTKRKKDYNRPLIVNLPTKKGWRHFSVTTLMLMAFLGEEGRMSAKKLRKAREQFPPVKKLEVEQGLKRITELFKEMKDGKITRSK